MDQNELIKSKSLKTMEYWNIGILENPCLSPSALTLADVAA